MHFSYYKTAFLSLRMCVCGCVRARARVSLCLQKIVPLGFDLFVTR